MTRTVKAPEVRREELLAAAQALFMERGYEGTSVGQILDEVGLSRGAFYHHFESKEALLHALIEQLVAGGEAVSREVVAHEAGALEKLNALFRASRGYKLEHAETIRAMVLSLYQPENLRLRHLMFERALRGTVPLLGEIIAQGIDEGVFTCAGAPEDVAEVILRLGASMNDALAGRLVATMAGVFGRGDAAVAEIERALGAYTSAIERVLGVPEGGVTLLQPGFVAALLGCD